VIPYTVSLKSQNRNAHQQVFTILTLKYILNSWNKKEVDITDNNGITVSVSLNH